EDLVAGEGELVAAAGADAVQRRQELEAGVLARVFDRETRLVGELAEVHLPGVRRSAQHEDVRAGAEDAFLQAGDDDGVHFRVLEANALDGVGQLDVDAEVVGIELQLVVGRQPGVFLDVHRQRGDRAVEGQFPRPVDVGGSIEGDGRDRGLGGSLHDVPAYRRPRWVSRHYTAHSLHSLCYILHFTRRRGLTPSVARVGPRAKGLGRGLGRGPR